MTQKKLRLILLIAAVLLVLTACAAADDPTATPQPTPTEEPTEVPTEEATEVVTEATDEPAAETTPDAEMTDEPAAETTPEPLSQPGAETTPDAEMTDEPDAETTPDAEMTDEATMDSGASTAAYMVVANGGDEDVTLTGVMVDFANMVEIHETTVEDDVATMAEVTDGLTIPAGESVTLEPGSFHVMLLDVQDDLLTGDRVSITLQFDNDAEITLTAAVRDEAPAAGATFSDGDLEISNVWVRPVLADGTLIVEVTEEPDVETTPEAEMTAEPEAETTPEAEMTAEPTEETTESSDATILDIAVSNSDFSTLVTAAIAAGLSDELDGRGPLTVFAPTNEAFNAALEELDLTFEELLENTDLVEDVLRYHIVNGEVYRADVAEEDSVPTLLAGASISVEATDEGLILNDGTRVIVSDIQASNGVVHVIDAVLFPPED